jgi:hypothetical protein
LVAVSVVVGAVSAMNVSILARKCAVRHR